MSRKLTIFDTTLRDGTQGAEINFTLSDKLQIAHALDEMAVDYIEGGFPLSNEREAKFFEAAASDTFSHAKITAFGSTRKPGGKADSDSHINALLEAETPAVTVVGKAWTRHVEVVLKTNLEENLRMIHDSVSYLANRDREVIFDLEHFFDGYKNDPEYAKKVLKAGSDAGAAYLVLCDTNGGTLPSEVARIMAELKDGGFGFLGVHFHNDSGMATANSIIGVEAGADHVQGTINGWGERCGNANLCTIIPNLCLKMGYKPGIAAHLDKLTSLSRFVAEKANIIPDKRSPYVGGAAFSHKAGQHADVILKDPRLMEHIDGAQVGNERKILLSELAGKSTVLNKIGKFGTYDKNSDVVKTLVKELKNKEKQGYEYEAAEASFELLVMKALGKYTPLIELNNYHLESYKTWETPSKTVGRIFLKWKDKQIMGAAVGVGPVETLDTAMRDALVPHYAFIRNIDLTDYRVRVLNAESQGTASKVRVFISFTDRHERTWDTVGVNENVIEASWEALTDGLEYYYNTWVIGG
ncbi:MAG: citramalate synthase [Spirochaetia bacterium]